MIKKTTHRGIEILRVQLEFDNLPSEFDGFTMLQLSDLHIRGKNEQFGILKDILGRIKTDAAAITGDFADTKEGVRLSGELIKAINTNYGIYCVLGNHDYWLDEKKLIKELKKSGAVTMVNRNKGLKIKNQKIIFIGVDVSVHDDVMEKVLGRANLKKAAKGTSKDDFRILLAHSPDIIKEAAEEKINLVLAGHTHGGQIRIPFIGALYASSRFGVKYAYGFFEEHPDEEKEKCSKAGGKENDIPGTRMFVSKGIGSTKVNLGGISFKIPLTDIRFNCKPEIAIIELRKVKKD